MVSSVRPGLEEALSDRLSFRRFVGQALADPVPDHSTLSRFRSELTRRGVAEALLAELNRQFDARGLVVKSGTLIDASLVAADCPRPHDGEPVDGRSDQDASWNAMPEKPLFGYNMHLAVDQGSALVRRAILTPGHVSDKLPFLDLVQGDERALYADRGDDGAWYRARLVEQGTADGVMAGDYRQRPLDAAVARPQPQDRGAPGAGRAHLRAPVTLVRLRPDALSQSGQERAPAAAAGARPEPAPRPGADRLRGESASARAAARGQGRPQAAIIPSAARSGRLCPSLRSEGTDSAVIQSSRQQRWTKFL